MESPNLRTIIHQVESLSLEQQEELFRLLRTKLEAAKHELAQRREWMKAQEQAFSSAWDNDADAVYDSM